LTDDPKIVFRAGTHRETMTIAYADFERLVSPKVAEFAQPG
jgi:prolyl-tRNA editing enzyme YbaK/EbsC (Cys-tRNA(Pro) deacylase)